MPLWAVLIMPMEMKKMNKNEYLHESHFILASNLFGLTLYKAFYSLSSKFLIFKNKVMV